MKLAIKHKIVGIQNQLTLLAVLGIKNFTKPDKSYVRLGTTWGGWWIDSNFLNKNEVKMLISAGLGGDISFEKETSTKNFKIIGIDPDPDCQTFIEKSTPKDFFEKNWVAALSSETGSKLLYKSDEGSFDSWTDSKIAGDRSIFRQFESIGITDLYEQLDVSEMYENTYLKMDIEGAELQVLDAIIKDKLKFKYLSVEFDFLSLTPALAFSTRVKNIWTARNLIRNLKKIGYEFSFNESFNLYWVLKS